MARAQFDAATSTGGAFVRQPSQFTDRVTPHLSSPPGGGLDALSKRPADRRYLTGEEITEADVRLFTTVVVPLGPDTSGWTTPHGRG